MAWQYFRDVYGGSLGGELSAIRFFSFYHFTMPVSHRTRSKQREYAAGRIRPCFSPSLLRSSMPRRQAVFFSDFVPVQGCLLTLSTRWRRSPFEESGYSPPFCLSCTADEPDPVRSG